MKLNIKKKIIMPLALCALFAAFSVGCAKGTEAFVHPPEDVPETEYEEASVSAISLLFDGNHIGYIPQDTETTELNDMLLSEKRSELESEGYSIKELRIKSDLTFLSSECKEDELIPSGEILKLILELSPKFTWTTLETETESVPFETVNKNSSDHLEGTKVVQTEGRNGEKELTFEAVYEDGAQLSRTKVSEKVLTKPQSKVVLIGTKKSTASTGKYIYPLKSVYITSYYGARTLNGKYDYHYGIDLRAANGTSVMASDGGKVIYAGKMGTYGTLVKIEHDNGNVTYYAHLSSVSVKVGQRVYQGQVISKSGSTGNVTGPHLHFELRVNGKHKNPLNYLK